MSNDVFYTDDTKLKDLTVGQLKDIIIETLSHGLLTRFGSERRQYDYRGIYQTPQVKEEPRINTDPYCGITVDERV